MSSLSALSVTALGPKAVTKPSVSAAKITMPLCGQRPLNGSGSSSPVGNSASPTILNAICKPSKLAVQSTPISPLSLHPQAVNKISSKNLMDQLRSLVVRCAARSPTSFPRFRLTLAGSIDSGHSKQTVTNFCVRYSVRSFLAPVNNLKRHKTCS